MTAAELVHAIREEVVEQNAEHYRTLLESQSVKARDPGMRSIIAAYERMDVEQQEAVQALVRQILVDTVSNLFGIIDGSSLLKSFREQFTLTYGAARTRLNGSLQEMFLSTET